MFHAAHSAAVPGQVAKLVMQVEEMTAACLRNKSRAVLIASFCLMCAAAAAQVTQTSTYAGPAVPTPSSIQMQMQQSQDPFVGGRVTEKYCRVRGIYSTGDDVLRNPRIVRNADPTEG